MKTFEKLVLAIGVAALVMLLWKMEPATVGALVRQVGWGFTLVVAQEAVAHLLNALGWRFAFAADQAASFPLRELVCLRVAGDAINYLTPSATIAGEITRTTRLNNSQGTEVRAASVLVAKCTQTLGEILFAVTGLLVVSGGQFPPTRWPRHIVYGAAGGFTLVLVALGLYLLWVRRRPGPTADLVPLGTGLPGLGSWLHYYLRRYPGRFGVSTLLFTLGYAWGAFEAYWICHFLKVPVSVGTAMTIEVFSVAVDGVFFMVPAKVGTQEGGKTAIFAWLGLSPITGFAFGVIRHVRELVWAGMGLALYHGLRRPGGDPGKA